MVSSSEEAPSSQGEEEEELDAEMKEQVRSSL
jgi:hypothetical protein